MEDPRIDQDRTGELSNRRLDNLRAVAQHLEQGGKTADALTQEGRGEDRTPVWRKRLAVLGPVGVVLAFALGKGKLLLAALKVTKLSTLLTMLLSVWAYGQLWGYSFALGFVLLIFVHELGHAVAMRRLGIPAGAPVFIPFVGAVIAMKGHPRDAWVESVVGIGGPVLGGIGAFACLVVAWLTGSLFWYALASTGFLINLFNMIPVSPLDGGRIVGVISRWLWVAGYVVGVAVFLLTWSPILMLILLLGLFGLGRTLRGPREGYFDVAPRRRQLMALAYFGLLAALTLGMWTADRRLEPIRSEGGTAVVAPGGLADHPEPGRREAVGGFPLPEHVGVDPCYRIQVFRVQLLVVYQDLERLLEEGDELHDTGGVEDAFLQERIVFLEAVVRDPEQEVLDDEFANLVLDRHVLSLLAFHQSYGSAPAASGMLWREDRSHPRLPPRLFFACPHKKRTESVAFTMVPDPGTRSVPDPGVSMSESSHRLIHHSLEESADLHPDKVALVHGETRATYAEINSEANSMAHRLRDLGIGEGDRVVLLSENGLRYVAGYYGALKSGAVVAPLSTDLKPDGLSPLLAELEPTIVMASSRFERLLQATDLDRFPIRAVVLDNRTLSWSSTSFDVREWGELVKNGNGANPELPLAQDSLANIIYTSGSSGRPKGVMLSHRNIVTNTQSIRRSLDLTEADIQMVVLPFFYVMGQSLLNTHLAVGGRLVINNKFAYPAAVLKEMVDEKVTGLSGVPSTFAYLLHRSPLARYRDRLHSLRYCSQAGGHMSRAVKKELRRVLPAHTRIYIMYGCTEASARLSCLEPEAFEDKIDSIGKAIPDMSLAVLDEHRRELPPGRQGELVASGPSIMLGYWRDPEATRRVLDEKGYHTGDLAHRDDDGYFYVAGRNDDLLKVGGHRINPTEIEDALMESDLLTEVVIQGVADDLLGHRLVAVAVSRNGCTENDILSFCAERLPRHKVPSQVKLVSALPKSANGKIDRGRCLELARTTPAQQAHD